MLKSFRKFSGWARGWYTCATCGKTLTEYIYINRRFYCPGCATSAPTITATKMTYEPSTAIIYGIELEGCIKYLKTLAMPIGLNVEKGRDCSIQPSEDDDEVELRFSPATYTWWLRNKRKIKALIEQPSFYSGTKWRCGMHVHLNRCMSDAHTRRFIKFWYINKEFIQSFSGRTKEEMGEWARFSRRRFNNLKATTKEYDHCRAVNLEHDYTIEVRVFAGTDKVDKFYANLGLVEAVRVLSRDKEVSLDRLTEYVEKRKAIYGDLCRALKEPIYEKYTVVNT